MSKECDLSCVGRNSSGALDNSRGAITNRLMQFTAAVMAMHTQGQGIAGCDIQRSGDSHRVASQPLVDCRPLHAREMFTHLEAQLRVERQRPAVISGLHETNAGGTLFFGTNHHRVHQTSAQASVLHLGVYRYGPEA